MWEARGFRYLKHAVAYCKAVHNVFCEPLMNPFIADRAVPIALEVLVGRI
jgi:hypothetical protein